MKAGFALNITDEGLGLLHRTSQGWMPLGEAKFDDPALAETLGFLRGTAAALAPGGVTTKLILPESQVLYTRVKAPGSARETKRKNIRSALEGLTPYAVEDLVFDFTGSGEEVQVAVVARETLEEAEGFANEHRLNPISFVARPDPEKFDGEPFFGPTQRASDFIPKGAKVEADKAVVKILASKSAHVAEPALDSADADEDLLPSMGRQEKPEEPGAIHVSDAIPEHVSETPSVKESAVASEQEEPASHLRFGLPADAKDALTTSVVAPDVDLPEETGEVAAEAVKESAEANINSAMPFISRRSGDDASGNQGAGITDVVAKMGERSESAAHAHSDKAETSVSAAEPSVISKVVRPVIGETVGKMPSSIEADKPRAKSVVPPAPPVRPSGGGALPSGVTAPVRRRVDAPLAAAERATRKPTEARRDGFGSARGAPERGKPRYMGLILTGALLAALLLAALLSSFLLPRDSEPQVEVPVGTDSNSTGGPNAVTTEQPDDAAVAPDVTPPDAVGSGTEDVVPPSDGATDGGAITPADEAAADGQVPETAVDPALIAPEALPSRPDDQIPVPDSSISTSNTQVGLTVPADENLPDPVTEAATDQADLSPLAEAGGPPVGQPPADPGGGALPELTPLNVVTAAPAVPDAPDQEALDNLILSNVDPDVLSEETTRLPETVAADAIIPVPETADAPAPAEPIAEAPQTAVASAPQQVVPAVPTPAGAPALVAATPEGAITADGVRVIAGRPDVVPPARPEAVRIAAATANAAASSAAAISAALASEAAEALNPLAEKRPLARPASLVRNDDDAALTREPARIGPRPNARPISVIAAANAAPIVPETAVPETADNFESASRLAVAISRVPVARPRIFAAAIDAAVASAAAEPVMAPVPAPEPQQEAVAAAPEEQAEPEADVEAVVAPTRGSVAKTATIANALNLSKLNLIGVYGSPKNRRALLRTSSGRYIKVEIGDRIEGGKVAAIGDNELSYVKNGRTVVLKMLRDS